MNDFVFYETDNAQEMLAMMEAVGLAVSKNILSSDTIFFYRCTNKYIYLTRSATILNLNLEKANEKGYQIARLPYSGTSASIWLADGGVMSCYRFQTGPTPKNYLFESYNSCGSYMLDSIGITYEKNGNDLISITTGKKFSGTGGETVIYDGVPVHHSLFAFTTSLEEDVRNDLNIVLNLPETKFAGKPHNNAYERVGTFEDILQRKVSFDEIKNILVDGYHNFLKTDIIVRDAKTIIELQPLFNRMCTKHKDRDWIRYGRRYTD